MEKIRNNIRGMVEQYLNENQGADIPKDTELFYKLKDNLIWVRVLSGNFFHQKDADNQNFGIGCQSGMANDYCAGQHGGLETYQLLRRVKDDDSYNFKTIGAITLNPQKDYVAEMRQRGNQPPGSNNVDEFSKEQLVDFFLDFLKEKFPNVDKFSDGPSLHVPSGNNLNTKDLIHFVPWRGDFTRGIYCTSVTKSKLFKGHLTPVTLTRMVLLTLNHEGH